MPRPASGGQATIYQRPVELLQKLIRFNTTNPPGKEAKCAAYINQLLTGAGFETTTLALDPKRPNLIARMKGNGEAPPLMLYGHVDVVTTMRQAWTYPPFEGKIVDGYIWGRGTLDMKGGVAMMLAAFLRAKAEKVNLPGDVVLCIVSDEEGYGDYGAKYLVENHPALFRGIRYAIGEFGGFTFYIGEQRFYPIMVAEKPPCRLKVTLRGQGGHVSLPVRGGAMAKLGKLLQQIDEHRLPVHITPVARQMFEAMAEGLPTPVGDILRQLLDPAMTDQVLDMLGDNGRLFDPLLHNTVTPTQLQGSQWVSVIPSEISVEVMGKPLPGYSPDDLIAELRSIIGDQPEIEVIRYDPVPAEVDMGLFDTLASILSEADPGGIPIPLLLSSGTDGRLFSRLGIQTYGFTPMKLPQDLNFSQTIHAADERIPVEAMDFGADAIYKAIQRFGK
jgi:acetylornithine deacetylase/succinyl-diaminopimelate desuccinylase-like protein